MNKIEKLLSVGDLRTVGNSETVVKMVLKNPKYFGNVVDTIQAEDPATRMRAADAVEKITRERPELLKPYKKHFLNEIVKIHILEREDIDVLVINYNNIISNPKENISKIIDFLGLPREILDRMMDAIDNKLYRQRRT